MAEAIPQGAQVQIDPKLDDLTVEQLAAIMPRCNASFWRPVLVPEMGRRGIVTPARVCCFLSQVAHESSELTRLEEGLSYSAERLVQVWPTRFRSLEEAKPYARAPEALANHVYAGRMGNGDASSGDGWKYRGGGLIQMTGRAAYQDAADATGLNLVEQPEQIRAPGMPAARTACWWWWHAGCNDLADATDGPTPDEAFRRLTRRINGGLTGLQERRAYWIKAKEVVS